MKRKVSRAPLLAAILLLSGLSSVCAQEPEPNFVLLKDIEPMGKWLRPHADYCEGGCTVGSKDIDVPPFLSNPSKLDKSSTFASLSGLYVSPKVVDALCGSENLRTLSVANTNFDDDDCKKISNCPNLFSIDLSWTSVTCAGLTELAKLKSLRVLKLRGVEITPEMAAILSTLPLLDYLDVSSNDLQSIYCVLSAKGFANLRTLALQDIDFKGFRFDSSLNLPKLRTLAIDQSRVNERLLNTFVSLPSFKVVRGFKLNEDDRQMVRRFGKAHAITVFEEGYMKGR